MTRPKFFKYKLYLKIRKLYISYIKYFIKFVQLDYEHCYEMGFYSNGVLRLYL